MSLLRDTSSKEINDIKLSLSVYCKQFYRELASAGYNKVNIPVTLKHLELLFMCLESSAIELKQKASIFQAFEQMMLLYKYQETQPKFTETFQAILLKIQQMVAQGAEHKSIDTIKSTLHLAEAMFAVQDNETQELVNSILMSQIYQAIDIYMFALNADLMALN